MFDVCLDSSGANRISDCFVILGVRADDWDFYIVGGVAKYFELLLLKKPSYPSASWHIVAVACLHFGVWKFFRVMCIMFWMLKVFLGKKLKSYEFILLKIP